MTVFNSFWVMIRKTLSSGVDRYYACAVMDLNMLNAMQRFCDSKITLDLYIEGASDKAAAFGKAADGNDLQMVARLAVDMPEEWRVSVKENIHDQRDAYLLREYQRRISGQYTKMPDTFKI